jgi:hypothetical protein
MRNPSDHVKRRNGESGIEASGIGSALRAWSFLIPD